MWYVFYFCLFQHNILRFHSFLIWWIEFHAFLQLNNNSLSTYHIYHMFITHSSAGGHLGSVHILATMRSAAVNMVKQVLYLWYNRFKLFVYTPSSGIIRSYCSSISISKEISVLFSMVAALIYISVNSIKSYLSQHPCQCLLLSVSWINIHSDRGWGDSSLCYWFAFPWWLGHLYLFFWK